MFTGKKCLPSQIDSDSLNVLLKTMFLCVMYMEIMGLNYVISMLFNAICIYFTKILIFSHGINILCHTIKYHVINF